MGWRDAAFADRAAKGECRLGCVIGIMSTTLSGPRNFLQWAPKFARKLVKTSLDGEEYAPSDMIGRMSFMSESYGTSADLSPGVIGLEDYGGHPTRQENKRSAAKEYRVRHHLWIQRSLSATALGDVYWLPGLGNPAVGLAKVNSDMAPLLRLLESGTFCPGTLRPLRGISSKEGGG